MNVINYQKKLDQLIASLKKENRVPTVFLHSCCAPCSSYCLEYLAEYFHITLLYYNPNIYPAEEYNHRVAEQRRLIDAMNEKVKYPIRFMEGKFEPEKFFAMAKGLEKVPEGGERCYRCYELRLREAAILAKEGGFDYFTTTLSISPLKNAQKLNEIGGELEQEYGVSYLYSDFKKKNGYKRSTELSKEYDLYRQDYCGCVYSKAQRLEEMKERGE
ncbi:epoxyqueuosine reductase QueH [Anaerosporobacter faecicola]|uniref:epoxyqueuosine reductase QueH n=1 Tax=Anaerosporobacter faecicola TaxID=2718714 RepID=UPI00143ADE09|nr:epoxyqueuosine reductase QueH [Anaerosporobacter faecicola]